MSIDSANQHNIINIGNSLKNTLHRLKDEFNSSCYTKVLTGDSNVGDGTASHHIFIICGGQKKIGIRLKFDEKIKAFHILGYWTTNL
jgi:hypothetical protein